MRTDEVRDGAPVVLVGEDSEDEPDNGRIVGEEADDVLRRLISPFTCSSGFVDQILANAGSGSR